MFLCLLIYEMRDKWERARASCISLHERKNRRAKTARGLKYYRVLYKIQILCVCGKLSREIDKTKCKRKSSWQAVYSVVDNCRAVIKR